MSSTNRSAFNKVRDVHISDYYKTSVKDIVLFLNEFRTDNPSLDFLTGNKIILDPCAGGSLHTDNKGMSYPDAILSINKQADIRTIDCREDSEALVKANYLDYELDFQPDVVITNPPFMCCREIVNKAMVDVKEDGLIIMLTRLNFFGSQQRKIWWQERMPIYCYVHSKRVKFNNGTTDSIEYCHVVWQKNNYGKFTLMRII